MKTVWLYIIIIITNWDVDVLIDIVLQDIDMHAPKCRAMYPLQACFAVHKSVLQYENKDENQCMLHNIHDGEISLLHTKLQWIVISHTRSFLVRKNQSGEEMQLCIIVIYT